MAYTLEDYLVAFDELKRHKTFSAGVQSTYLAILMEFRRKEFPPEIDMTVRDLGAAAGLKSVESVHEAKLVLKNHRLVDFHNKKRVTAFILCTGHLPNENQTNLPESTKQTPNDSGLISYTHAQENGGTPSPTPLSPKSLSQSFKKSQPNQPNQTSLAEDVRLGETGGRDTEIDVVDFWRSATGKPLDSPADQFVLRQLDEKHGREIVKVAIEECVYCGGKSLRYFEKCLASTLTRLKGGEKDGRDSQEVRVDRRVGREQRDESGALGKSETTGKGRFDDEPELDYSWIHAKQSDTSESEG